VTHVYVPKVWGNETWIVNTPEYCGKLLQIYSGYRCSLHMHPVKDEAFYISAGIVDLETGDSPETIVSRTMLAGESARILPGTWHRFSSFCGATIVEFSTHHDDADVVRNENSGPIPVKPGI